MAKKQQENIGALAFWLILIATSLIPLLWLQVWAYQNINMKAFVVGNIFIVFIILTFAFDFNKNLFTKNSTFGSNSFSFVLGLLLGTGFGLLSEAGKQSIFSLFTVSQQYLLSEISAQLPLFWSIFTTTIGAPVAEELLFLISIPAILFVILAFVSGRFKIFENPIIQVAVVAAVVGPLFAFFHVGNAALIGFIVSAMIFRVLLIGLVHGDAKANLIPLIALLPSFAVGYHMANNIISVGGWGFFINIMMLDIFGFVVLFMLAAFIVSGIWYIVKKTIGKKK